MGVQGATTRLKSLGGTESEVGLSFIVVGGAAGRKGKH